MPATIEQRLQMTMPPGPLATHPMTKEVITDKNVERCKIQLLNSQFGAMLRSTFVKHHPGYVASSNVLPKNKDFFTNICKSPMIYRSFQYGLFVPPLETLNGNTYKTRMSDYKNQCKRESGYLYGGMESKWPEIDVNVTIKTGMYCAIDSQCL